MCVDMLIATARTDLFPLLTSRLQYPETGFVCCQFSITVYHSGKNTHTHNTQSHCTVSHVIKKLPCRSSLTDSANDDHNVACQKDLTVFHEHNLIQFKRQCSSLIVSGAGIFFRRISSSSRLRSCSSLAVSHCCVVSRVPL